MRDWAVRCRRPVAPAPLFSIMHGSPTAHTPASAPRRPGPTPPQLLAHADITLLEIGSALSAMEIQAHEGAYSPAIVGLLATLHELVAQMTEFREELRCRVGSGGGLGPAGENEFQCACLRLDNMTTGLWKATNSARALMRDVEHAAM